MLDRDAAEDEPHAVRERVSVDAQADPELRHTERPGQLGE